MYKSDAGKHWRPEWDSMVINFVFASKRKSGHSGNRVRPPEKHLFEKQAEELDVYLIRGFGAPSNPIPDKAKFRPAVYPVSWGWNAGGRAGNPTAFELREPRLTNKSGMRQYISAASGTHHSLLVSDESIVYSFGDGRFGQLGYGNDYMDQPGVKRPKGGFVQSCPRQVTPSGSIQFGQDLKISQVACGTTFSIAREMTSSEGVSMVRGLEDSEQSLTEMRKLFFDSDKVQWAWSNVRQERYRANRVSEGRLITWGTGKHGELGLGQYILSSPRPRIIPRLQHINIMQVSAGKTHVLAISTTGFLYTWGSGKAGKLGHGDWEDRSAPLMVKFFETFFVECCAAGDAHSAVLTTNRKGVRDTQLRRVSTFGRGAHGRLGNGTNKSTFTPIPVIAWPPSAEGAQFIHIACGGAHTLALASIRQPITKARPWGFRTMVLSWGYGRNGQLGTGYNVADSFVPVKARIPSAFVIAELAAGKSWSMARSLGGELWTWGKGLRGQLGQGNLKFSFAPRKLKTFASFVQLSAGHAHNVCLSAPKKHFNPKVVLAAAGNPKILMTPFVPLATKQMESQSVFSFDCCRRHLNSEKARQRFICKTCDISSVCYVCAKQCHHNHDLVIRRAVPKVVQTMNPLKKKRLAKKSGKKVKLDQKKVLRLKKKTGLAKEKEQSEGGSAKQPKKSSTTKADVRNVKVPFCRCGMFSTACRVIPVIPEGNEAQGEDFSEDSELPSDRRLRIAAIRIQRMARTYIERQHIKLLKKEAAEVRFEVCTAYWQTRIMKQIWSRLERARQKFRETREMEEMYYEDATRKRFDYFYALQTAVGGMDAMTYGTKALLGAVSVAVPRVHQKQVSDQLRPSYAFSWSSIRQQQLKLHPRRRVPPAMLAELTRNVARFDAHESQPPDPDVGMFFRRFMRDYKTEKDRDTRESALAHREAARAAREERARSALIAMRFAGKAALAQAAAFTRPVPPSLPPPPHVLAAQAAVAKAEKKKRDLEMLQETQALEDAPFNMYAKIKRPRIFRRNTIGAPEKLYERLVSTQAQTPLRTFAKRRYSFPDNSKLFYPEEVPALPYVESIKHSLSLFSLRDDYYNFFLDQKFSKMVGTMSDKIRRRRISEVMGSSALVPRLPIEMNLMVLDGYRRRTVGEPERLSKQLHVMFEIRNKWSDLREIVKDDEKMTFRRRSFDHGEVTDGVKGILDTLGYEFEEPYRKQLILEFRKDSSKMERTMIESGFLKSALPAFKASKFGSFLKRNVEDEEAAAKKEKDKDSKNKQPTKSTSRLASVRVTSSADSAGIDFATGGGSSQPQLWQEHFTENGETYYYCPQTGESSWAYPQGNFQLLSQYFDDEGRPYWYNWQSGDSFYE